MNENNPSSKKNHPADAIMAEAATPQPLKPEDLATFALDDNFSDSAAVKALAVVPVGKPPKEAFVRTHPNPECWRAFAMLELKESGKTYLVMPAVAAALRDEGESTLVHCHLVLTVDRRGNPRLWPLKITERQNEWNTSARRAAELAKDKWLRLESNINAGYYDSLVAVTQDVEPAWPKESYLDVLQIAFRDRIITDMDHEILKELRGQF